MYNYDAEPFDMAPLCVNCTEHTKHRTEVKYNN